MVTTEIDYVNFEGSITFHFPMSINQFSAVGRIQVKFGANGSVPLTTSAELSEIAHNKLSSLT